MKDKGLAVSTETHATADPVDKPLTGWQRQPAEPKQRGTAWHLPLGSGRAYRLVDYRNCGLPYPFKLWEWRRVRWHPLGTMSNDAAARLRQALRCQFTSLALGMRWASELIAERQRSREAE